MKTFPFAALVGQENLKTALLICAVNPAVGGVLIRGDKGTAKSTAARGLAEIMPAITQVAGCQFNCAPGMLLDVCEVCHHAGAASALTAPPFVNLPLGATEDRVIGSIDFERALKDGKRAFQPGLLAAAHRGILYIDEVNLLPDHLVDVLLDVAAMGVNAVQREGMSISHPAKFALLGTMNLEEGDLRPQLLDRFGMMVEVEAPEDYQVRAEVVRRRLDFEEDAERFGQRWQDDQERLRAQVLRAREVLTLVRLADEMLVFISQLCCQFGARSLRADLVVSKVSRTLAALSDRCEVNLNDIRIACRLALPHRSKRRATEPGKFSEEKLDEIFNQVLDEQSQKSLEGQVCQEASQDVDPETHQDDLSKNLAESPSSEQIFSGRNPGNPMRIETEASGAAGRDGRRSMARGGRQGRFLRAAPDQAPSKLAVNATLQHSLIRNGGVLDVSSQDLHQKIEVTKNANLILFVVDASGSMAALKRMELVKGAVMNLLDDAYQRRDEIAVVAFRGQEATLVLSPTRSVEVAHRQLAQLPTGGRTPLAQALSLSREVLSQQAKCNALEPLIILLTDGKANVPLSDDSDPWQDSLKEAESLAQLRLPTLVIDTESGYLRFRRATELAKILNAECLSLESVSADSLGLKIRSKLRGNKKTAL